MQGSAADGEALYFELEDDDLMDEDGATDVDASPPHPKLKSAITASSSQCLPKKTKGRGFRQESDSAGNLNGPLTGSDFETLTTDGGPGPQRSIEGWIVLVTGDASVSSFFPQVPPAELEGLLVSHPSIADAAVVPQKDVAAGEVPVAFVVRSNGFDLTEEAVKEFIAKQVVFYKRLHKVYFIHAIPKSPSGKILRKDLNTQSSLTLSGLN